MGLDGVELVIEVEETFGIKIDDDVASKIATVGEFSDLITRKLAGMNGPDCPTAKSFYRLRRSFLSVLGIQRNALRPSTPTLPFLPPWRRMQIWKRLEKDLGMQLPPLSNQAGKCAAWGAKIAFFTFFFAVWTITHDIFCGFGAAIAALIPGVLFGYVVGILCFPLTLLPEYRTIGGLARGLVAYNYDKFVPLPPTNVENEQVWNKLCELIVQQIGVKREKIQRATKFVEELGF